MDKKSEVITTVPTMSLDAEIQERIYYILLNEFDKAELRNCNSQMKAFRHPEYFISTFGNNIDEAFVLWWNFKEFIFIEYLWVALEKRHCGRGTILLEELKRGNRLIILEVLKCDNNAKFYFEMGFYKNNISYKALDLNSLPALEYFLLSYNHKLTETEYNIFIDKIGENEYQF